MNGANDSARAVPAETQDKAAEFVARYEPAIRRFFARRLSVQADIDDLTQELFARLLKRSALDSIDNAEGYLFQAAANMLHERARREARHRTDAYDPLDPVFTGNHEERSPERVLLGREAYARMVQALQELPERSRTIFLLNRYEELSGTEIARRLGLSVSAVEKHMMRAIAHLRARLG